MSGKSKNKGGNKQNTNEQNKDGGGADKTNPKLQQQQHLGQIYRQQTGNAQTTGHSGYLITDPQGNVSSYSNFQPQQPMHQNMQYTQGPFQETRINNNNPILNLNGTQNMSSFVQGPCNPINHQVDDRTTHMNLQHNGMSSASSGQWQSQNNNLPGQTITFELMNEMVQKMSSTFLCKLETIETKISKLDSIEKEISLTRYDISDLKRESSELRQKVEEVEVSCGTVSSLFDDCKKVTDENKRELSNLKSENSYLKQNCENLKEELLELKARSMQENLLFFGLAEPPRGFPDETESKLRDFLKHELSGIDPGRIDTIVFDRVHRLGRPKRDPENNSRPIVAKFERYIDRELIRKAGIDLNRRRNGYSIREQFPPEIEERRKPLYPVMRRYLENDQNKVSLVRDKLYINGQLYDPSSIQQNRQIGRETGARPKQYAPSKHNDRRQQYEGNSSDSAAAASRWEQVNERSASYRGWGQSVNRDREQTRSSDLLISNPFNPLQNLRDKELIITPMKVGPGKKKATSPLIEEIEPKKIRDATDAQTLVSDVIREANNCVNTPSMETDDPMTLEDNNTNSAPLTRSDGETSHVQNSGTMSANNDSEQGVAPS